MYRSFLEKVEHSKELIRDAVANHGSVAVACSFGKDSMVAVHLARNVAPSIPVFSVMTVYKPETTLAYLVEMNRRFNLQVTVYLVARTIPTFFRQAGVKTVLLEDGEFQTDYQRELTRSGRHLYETGPDRCCFLLKVVPTKAAVAKLDAWLTGLRNTEGETRVDYKEIEDRGGGLIKINPILEWTELDIWRYLAINQIPVNPLYGQGYRSLGCEPCSVITSDEQPERAGRWRNTSKCGGECGIHTKALRD